MTNQDFRSYINMEDNEVRQAFLHGFLTAADAFGVAHPTYDAFEAWKWALNQLTFYAINEDERKRETARKLLNVFSYSKQYFREMLLHGTVNDKGQYVGLAGKPTDDPLDCSLFVAVMPDGREISADAYNALSAEEQATARKVRYIELTDLNTGMVISAREDDIYLMQEMLTRDILCGDPINSRYNFEVFSEDGCLKHLYCGSVALSLCYLRTQGALDDDDTMIPPALQLKYAAPHAARIAKMDQTLNQPQPYMQSACLGGDGNIPRPYATGLDTDAQPTDGHHGDNS